MQKFERKLPLEITAIGKTIAANIAVISFNRPLTDDDRTFIGDMIRHGLGKKEAKQ